ncbi:hypothetical protein K466DRAFT_607125 [Polyporus arcularius HHB13444]|uniref:Uncharacterized protein n=1 Tax=Polyporus arcularius HHB13444 TaxID=1314778 RepID=A0A5C3NNT9_9APHY|nr:hypothetical protein K466DRAFT_607125 [Polyporus arcularius HHB13444]
MAHRTPVTTSSGAPVTPDGVALRDLKCNAIDLHRLRSFLGEGEVYQQFKHRFDTADLAWLVAGAHKDGKHFINPDQFHPMWAKARLVRANGKDAIYQARREFRDKLRDLVWDALTVLDRISGGASILIHSPGTVEPGHPLELPFLKFDVYVPQFIGQENPLVDRPLASIVQTFAQEVALPVTRRWRRAFEKLNLKLAEVDTSIEPPSHLPFMPDPKPRTTLYRCHGRSVGELEDMLRLAADTATPRDRDGPARRSGAREVADGVRDKTDDVAASLRAEIAHLQALITEKDGEIAHLRDIIEDRDRDIIRLEEEVDALSHASPLPVAQPLPAVSAPTPTCSPLAVITSPSRRSDPAVQPARHAELRSSTPFSSPFSSMNISSWSSIAPPASSPPSPAPSPTRAMMEWVMPAPYRPSPAPVATTPFAAAVASRSTDRVAASPMRSSALRRFDIVGPRTHAILVAHNLSHTLH